FALFSKNECSPDMDLVVVATKFEGKPETGGADRLNPCEDLAGGGHRVFQNIWVVRSSVTSVAAVTAAAERLPSTGRPHGSLALSMVRSVRGEASIGFT